MILGVDYASVDANARPNLAAAKATGLRFAFVRASYATWADPTCARDRDAIRTAGLVFGAYLFPVMSASSPAPEHQVAAFAASAGLIAHRDFAPVLDIEFPGGIAKTGLSRKQCAEWIGRAVAALRHTFGCTPIVYTSARVLDGTDSDALAGEASDALMGCPLWLARYPYKTRIPAQIDPTMVDSLSRPPVTVSLGGDPNGWWVHQYQGDAVHFPGFTATVDVDRFNPLRRGAKGSRVAWLQERLKIADGYGIDRFEGDTETHVELFQDAHGLEVDGIVGPATFAAIGWEA